MPALSYPLVVEQGADYTLSIPVLDANAQPVTVNAWTVVGQIRESFAATVVLHDLDVSPSGSVIVLHIPAEASSDWTFRTARYDVEMTSPAGDVSRLIEGLVIVRPQVTR